MTLTPENEAALTTPDAKWFPRLRRVALEYLSLTAALAGLVLLFSLLTDHFWSFQTLTTIANQTAALTVIAVGMTVVLLVAEIDLSVGSVMALSGSVFGLLVVNWGWSPASAAVCAISVGLLCGLVTGGISVGFSVPSFLVSLAMLEIARGGAYLVTNSQTVYVGSSVESIAAPSSALGLSPAFFAAISTVVLAQFVLSRSVFGRHLLAIGGNPLAARYSGINVEGSRLAAFTILGALSGLAGVFHTARLTAADPNSGIGLELSAIAAVVIGGTSLSGGRGSAVRSLFGVMIIAVLQSGLAQVGATEPTKRIVTGLVIVAAVIADACRTGFSMRYFSDLLRKLLRRN